MFAEGREIFGTLNYNKTDINYSMIISINGKILDKKEVSLFIKNETFLSITGALETMRTYHKHIFRLQDHLQRLYVSDSFMNITPLWTLKKTEQEIIQVLQQSPWQEVRIRIIITENQVIIMMEELVEKPQIIYKKGVKLVSFLGKRTFPKVKQTGDTFCAVSKKYATEHDAYESLFVDGEENITECTYSNIFWIINEQIYTTDKNILFGITRQTVLDIVEEYHYSTITYEKLLEADEVFITQTTSGILPVVQIDDRKIGNGIVGNRTKQIMKDFDRLVWKK